MTRTTTFTSFALTLVLSFGTGCEAETSTFEYDQLAERVAAEAELDDWQVCVSDESSEAEPPATCELPPSEAAPLELSSNAEEQIPAMIECWDGCCFFFDVIFNEVTVCCTIPDGPAQCEVFDY